MLIEKNWAIVRPTDKNELLISNDLRALKFVQLLMAKSVILSIKESAGVETSDSRHRDIQQKIKLVYALVTGEFNSIKTLSAEKQQEWFQVAMLDTVNEFINIVGIADEFTQTSYNSERSNLLVFQDTCKEHTQFLFQVLHNVDYQQDYALIKENLIREFKAVKRDTRFVFTDLNNALLRSLKND